MANSFTYSGPGTRWAAEEATDEAKLNIARINIDHVHEALNTITNTDAADGVLTSADYGMRIDNPFHIEVADGVVWTLGWWQSSDTRWWLLGNTADVTSFTRGQAEFYIPTATLQDVPTS